MKLKLKNSKNDTEWEWNSKLKLGYYTAYPVLLGRQCYWVISNLPLLRRFKKKLKKKRRLMPFGHLVRMDESADARRILTAVPHSDFLRHDIAATCVLKMPLNPNHPSIRSP